VIVTDLVGKLAYFTIQRGQPTGYGPIRAVAYDSTKNRFFLLIESDGSLYHVNAADAVLEETE
jgi:hypothetical protein